MPQSWIPRTLEPVLNSPAEQLRLLPAWLLLGPRQVLLGLTEEEKRIVDPLAPSLKRRSSPRSSGGFATGLRGRDPFLAYPRWTGD